MIGYVTLGTNRLDDAVAFYDALLGPLGASRMMPMPQGGFAWGRDWVQPMLAVAPPFDGQPASVGNGVMISLIVDARADVDAVHANALSLGGRDEGAPGLRGPEGEQAFYGAYFRDLDGNKLCVFKMGPA